MSAREKTGKAKKAAKLDKNAKKLDKKQEQAKKRKGKLRDKPDPNRFTEVQRKFYELYIADIHRKIEHLKEHLKTLDEKNINFTKMLDERVEDSTDVAAQLDNTLRKRNETIEQLEQRLIETNELFMRETVEAADKIHDLEAVYRAMQGHLTAEVKMLNAKLNSLQEFYDRRYDLGMIYEKRQMELEQQDLQHEEYLREWGQAQIDEKDALKKKVEASIWQLSQDVTNAVKVRNKEYTHRLIRENIAFKKQVDILVQKQIKLDNQILEEIERRAETKQKYDLLECAKHKLLFVSKKQVKAISKASFCYEQLLAKYKKIAKCRKLLQESNERVNCTRFACKDIQKKLNILEKEVEMLKCEINTLKALQLQNENEKSHLRHIIRQIRIAVEMAIGVAKAPVDRVSEDSLSLPEIIEQKELHRSPSQFRFSHSLLLSEIMAILVNDLKREIPGTPSQETASNSNLSRYGSGNPPLLLHASDSAMEILKYDPNETSSTDTPHEHYVFKDAASLIIPKARIKENTFMIDVETSSTLYVSSAHDYPEAVEVEEEPFEIGGTSESESLIEEQTNETKTMEAGLETLPTKATSATNAASVKEGMSKNLRKPFYNEIIDVEEEQEYEEYGEGEEFVEYDQSEEGIEYEEDEEWSVNLHY